MDFFALFLIFLEVSAVAGLGWEFPYFTKHMENITLVGDSYLRNDIIRLTRAIDNTTDTPAPTWSAGAVVFKNPIALFDPQTNSASSFSTTFSFSITISKSNPTSTGDGLAFCLSPNGLSSATAKPLGLPNTFVAVEFDTCHDPNSGNPDNKNHVCIEHSLISLQKEDLMNVGIDLKSGDIITAWIDYETEAYQPELNALKVFLSYSGSKPLRPFLTANVDLSKYFRDNQLMHVGFSASSEGRIDVHQIKNWTFHINIGNDTNIHGTPSSMSEKRFRIDRSSEVIH